MSKKPFSMDNFVECPRGSQIALLDQRIRYYRLQRNRREALEVREKLDVLLHFPGDESSTRLESYFQS